MLSKWEKELDGKRGRTSIPVIMSKQTEPLIAEPVFAHAESWNGEET